MSDDTARSDPEWSPYVWHDDEGRITRVQRGNECLFAWAAWFEEHHSVGVTRVGRFVVSTVFLGVAMGPINGAGLWETMIFETEPWRSIGYREHHSTLIGARLGHAAAVEYVRLHLGPHCSRRQLRRARRARKLRRGYP